MPWPFGGKSRRPPPGERASDGVHRSQALGLVVDHLARRPGSAVLDLGPPSNETLGFFGRFFAGRAELVIGDLYRACAEEGSGGLAYRSAGEIPLPAEGELFDAILVWDLLHYVAPAERAELGARLARLTREGAQMLIVASWAAPIPPSPVHYRVLDRDRLGWHAPEGRRLPAPGLVPRRIEKTMPGFVSERVQQLQSGLQEIVLRRADAVPPAAEALAPPPAAH